MAFRLAGTPLQDSRVKAPERTLQTSCLSKFEYERGSPPLSGPQGYYFPWSDESQLYDLTSYNPQYIENRITQQMATAFIKDVQAIRLIDPKKANILETINLVNMVVGIVAGIAFIALSYFASPAVQYQVTNHTTYKTVSESDNKGSSTNIIYGIAHIAVGVLAWYFLGSLRFEKMREGRLALRIQQIQEVFEKHKTSTFGGLRLSLVTGGFGGYVGLKFDWKEPSPAGENGSSPIQVIILR